MICDDKTRGLGCLYALFWNGIFEWQDIKEREKFILIYISSENSRYTLLFTETLNSIKRMNINEAEFCQANLISFLCTMYNELDF